jgi:hypothetical protein
MRLYRTQAGKWAGTQIEAGKGFQLVEVPTDKPGLLAWLNAQPIENTERANAPSLAAAEEHHRLTQPAGGATKCPKCQMRPETAREAADCCTAAELAHKIGEQTGPALDMLVEAVVMRLRHLQQDIKRAGQLR